MNDYKSIADSAKPAGEPWGYINQPRPWSPRHSEQVVKVTREPQPDYGFTLPVYIAAAPAPSKPEGYRIYKDGNEWCAVGPGFIDLQQSPAGFADTPGGALARLMQEHGKEWAEKNGEWVKSATKPEPASEDACPNCGVQFGWHDVNCKKADREPASAPSEGAHVEAVATVRERCDEGVMLDWLVEGGISSLPDGVTLYIADKPLTDDNGSGEVYLAPTSAAMQESKAVTADGDFARMAEAEGATVDWGDHGSPPSFPSWGAWGRFCDAVRAIAPPSPVKEVTDQQIYDAWFALSEADNRGNEHVRLGGVLPFARAVLALAGGKRGGE